MNYVYTTSKIKFTEAMKAFTEDHFHSIEKFLSPNEPIKITLEKNGTLLTVKCQIVSKMNKRIRAEARNEDFYLAIVEARDILEKQIKKKKEKSYWKERIDRVEVSSEVAEVASVFVKNKVFVLDSITPEQAVDEMNSMAHDWYAFRDVDNDNKISVVYRRFDGKTFGLVELN